MHIGGSRTCGVTLTAIFGWNRWTWPAPVVTFDALHTVRANLDWLVTDKKAHYIAVVT